MTGETKLYTRVVIEPHNGQANLAAEQWKTFSMPETVKKPPTAAQVERLVTQLLNDAGETYFVKIAFDNEKAAARFLQDLWQSVDGRYYPTLAQSVEEWTDRGRAVRSTFSRFDGACIRTHAISPSGDKQQLHEAVIAFLRSRGFAV